MRLHLRSVRDGDVAKCLYASQARLDVPSAFHHIVGKIDTGLIGLTGAARRKLGKKK